MNRFKRIDVLRAIAVFLVMGRHLAPCPREKSAIISQITGIWYQGGWVGVDLFFVLSGFLVAGLLFREHEKFKELDLKRFLIRRGFKIYPPFWLLIGSTLVLVRLQDVPWRSIACELLFLQNYGSSLWNHTWSLAVEEHFYLLLALGFFVLTRRRSTRPFKLIPAAFVSVALLCLALRILLNAHAPYDPKTHLYPSHLRLDGLFFGVFLSYLFHRHPIQFLSFAQRFRHLLLGCGALLLLPAFCFPLESTPFIRTYGLTLLYVGSGCLLVSALGFQAPTTRVVDAMAYVGSHSYSVYLWHSPAAHWGAPLVLELLSREHDWFSYAGVYIAGSLAFGIALAIVTESPVLRLRDRLFPSRGTPLSTDATGANNALQRARSARR